MLKQLHIQSTKFSPGVYVSTAITLLSGVNYSNAVCKLSNPSSFVSLQQLPLPKPPHNYYIKQHYQKRTTSFNSLLEYLTTSTPRSNTNRSPK